MGSAYAVLPLLADAADGDHMNGWGWGWMMGGWLVMILVVALIVWAFRGTRPHDTAGRAPAPEEILAERFARGEISAEEYRERRAVLKRP